MMQQIDEIRRMSELAKSLREHGLAKDNSEAFRQAQSVTSSDPKIAAERKQAELIEKVALLERKADAQQKSIDDLRRFLDDANVKLLDAQRQITALDAKLRDAPSQQAAWPQQAWQPPASPPVWNQPYPPQVETVVRAPSTVPIDRNGVAPADVSVEKFFNFSGKR